MPGFCDRHRGGAHREGEGCFRCCRQGQKGTGLAGNAARLEQVATGPSGGAEQRLKGRDSKARQR